MIPYENNPHFDIIYGSVKNCFGDISDSQAATILREVVLAPDEFVIDCGKEKISRREVVQRLADYTVEKYRNKDKKLAYAELLDEAAEIIKHTNDGFISEEDARERSDFMDKITKQEFEHFAALAILRIVHEEEYHELRHEILFQLQRLREINDLIRKYTRGEVNSKVSQSEYESALPIYKMLKSLKTLGYGYTLSLKERISLGINHDDDEDLDSDYAYENWIKLLMLLQLRHEQNINAATVTNSINDLCHADEKIGHASTILDDINEQISELRGTLKKRRFDKSRFNMLEEVYNSDNRHYIG